MNLYEIEQRWKLINHNGIAPYKSLRISSDCIPDLYLSLDLNGNRFLILNVPAGILVQCSDEEMENLTLQWHEETRYVLIGLRNKQFTDLFNELILSLYSKIKGLNSPNDYTKEFISSFHKWTHFFDASNGTELSECEIKGLFGELIVLLHYLRNSNNVDSNIILDSWQGPYKSVHDFIFSSINVEVKTKELDKSTVRISNENQLQAPTNKSLELVIVDVVKHNEGLAITALINEIKDFVLEVGADITIFIKALSKAGVANNNLEYYESYRWNPIQITFHNYNDGLGAPRITPSGISDALINVEYDIRVGLLDSFINNRISM